MMLSELLLEQQIEMRRRLDDPRIAYRAEAMAARRSGPGLRHALAAALVRAGVWLDRTAAEPAVALRRQATH